MTKKGEVPIKIFFTNKDMKGISHHKRYQNEYNYRMTAEFPIKLDNFG